MRVLGILLLSLTTLHAEPLKIGEVAPMLTLTDIRALPRTLDDFGKPKAIVLAWINTTCPVAARSLPTLQAMHNDYAAKGVQFVAVNAAEDDSIVAIATQAVQHNIAFPFVKDFDGAAAKSLGVKRTPEVAVLDGARKLVYRGRIDDQYRLNGNREKPTSTELKDAIDAVLAGKPVTVSESIVDGCPITFPHVREPKKVTYAEHVAPILAKHCWECHKTGGMGPFSLTSFHQAASRAESVAEAVRDQRMPPWFASHEFGPFTNRRGLTADERTIIADWVRSGAPRGDETKEPAAPVRQASPWLIGEPDLIIETLTIDLPATGDIKYQFAALPHIFLEETWVNSVQILPSNPRSLHHCNMAHGGVLDGFKESNFITGQVPNGEPMILDDDVAYRIPKGSILGLEMHFVSTGRPEKCKVSVGFRFPRKPVQKSFHCMQITNRRFAITPGDPAHKVVASRTLEEDCVGAALFSHMHVRGKDMTFNAHTPDGKSETLLVVGNYNFSWQQPYRWKPGTRHFPKGTKLECIAHYDNSTFNPFNPDPKKTVRNGLQTHQEMMIGYFFHMKEHEKLNLVVDPKNGQAR